jgi:hypothetical protein
MKKILVLLIAVAATTSAYAQKVRGMLKAVPASENAYIDTGSYTYLSATPIQAVVKGDSVEVTLLYDVRSILNAEVRLSIADSDFVKDDLDVQSDSRTTASVRVKKTWELGTVLANDYDTQGLVKFMRPRYLSKTFWVSVAYLVNGDWGHKVSLKVELPPLSHTDRLKELGYAEIPEWLWTTEYEKILAAY